MKMLFLFLLFLIPALFLVHRVGQQPRHNATGTDELYETNLARSAAEAVNPPPGSPEAEEMVARVRRAFTPFDAGNIRSHFPEAYAAAFYFRDAFHTFTDREEMVEYMIKTALQSPGVTFEFEAPARNGIDFYLPWVMVIPDRKGGEAQRSIGVSRLRFNERGQVIFHQDYWDSADVLVPRVPVANGLIELVRRRF